MISNEQFINGLMMFIENEVLPSTSGFNKISLGAAAALVQRKSAEIMENLKGNKIAKNLGIIDENGMIDAESLINIVIDSVGKNTNGKLEIPGGVFFGNFIFDKKDLQKLHNYMTTTNS